jgi:hypothetical protein
VTGIEGHVTGTLTSRVKEIPTPCQPSDLTKNPTNSTLPPVHTGGDRHHTRATQPSDVRPIRADYREVTGGDGRPSSPFCFLLSPILVPFAICGESKARQRERVRFVCSRASLRGRDGIAVVQGCELLRFALNELSSFPIGAQSTQIGVPFSCLVRSLSGKVSREFCAIGRVSTSLNLVSKD